MIFNLSILSFAQQGYNTSLSVIQEFCDVSSLQNNNAKEHSNIIAWIDANLKDLFFGFTNISNSANNNSGFMRLNAYDNGEGINLPLYGNKILFSPSLSSKRKLNEKQSRNLYQFDINCNLDILNYCDTDYVKSFDYSQKSYFKIGIKMLGFTLGKVIANTLNEFVDYDYLKKETAIQVFVEQLNLKYKTNITIDKKGSNNEFGNLLEELKSIYTDEEIIDIIFDTFIKSDLNQDTEDAINDFYDNLFATKNFSVFVNDLMAYKLKIYFVKGGVLKVSKNILEIVDSETKEVIKSTKDYIELPVKGVNIMFAVDNTPRLIMSFNTNYKGKLLYKINTGNTQKYINERLERTKITKQKPEYLRIDELKFVFYNDRIQVFGTSSHSYKTFQIVNKKKSSFLVDN